MRKFISFLLLLCIASFVHAQYKVQIIVKEQTNIKHDSIYISGTFNSWDSMANPEYRLQPKGSGTFSIVLNLPRGTQKFKITRGSWFSVEKRFNGDEVPDHILNVKKDTTIRDTVVAWRDQLIKDKWLAISDTRDDTDRIKLYTSLATAYGFYPEWYNADSALYCASQALAALQRLKNSGDFKSSTDPNYAFPLINNQEVTASLLHTLGNYIKALELRLDNIKLATATNDPAEILFTYTAIISDYRAMADFSKVLMYAKRMQHILNTSKMRDEDLFFFKRMANFSMAEAYYKLSQLDSAVMYTKDMHSSDTSWSQGIYLANSNKILGDIYTAKGDFAKAFSYYKASIYFSLERPLYHVYQVGALAEKGMAVLYQRWGKIDSALLYAQNALNILQNNLVDIKSWGENANNYLIEIMPLVAELYKQNNHTDSAYKYLKLSVDLRDSLYNTEKVRQFQTLSFNEAAKEQQQMQQAAEERRKYEERMKVYGLIAILLGVVIVAMVLYRNNKQKQKINLSLEKQKMKLEKTLDELKLTQKQLIQSEKMASLGELTAGIAHEIQNPLNFVNNFSEINTELIDELKNELTAGNQQQAISIANDIKENEEKIVFHGKRADSIVKGMLQHSRSSNGVKEPTDVNVLADEYLRLAYHGLRAKDKSFNATVKTDFDKSIGNIDIIPQDVGRVLLNLITNAFYAVSEKKNELADGYNPTVTVTTEKLGSSKVQIKVKDNGNGISQKNLDKIFQPFFTTKPTGQGTGLGLSLSYDIIKAHGGEIKVETREGEGSEFVIQLSL